MQTILDPRQPEYERLPRDVQRMTISDVIERELAAGQLFGPFHRSWLRERAPERVRRYLELATKRPGLVGIEVGYSALEGQVSAPPSSFAAVTASATETQLWVPSIWTPIPSNSMRAGKVYKVSFGGVFTSTATPGVLTWTPRVGQSATVTSNPTLGGSNATAPPASLTAQSWYGEFTMVVRSLGMAASGATVVGNGFVLVQGAAAATGVVYVMGGVTSSTADNVGNSGIVVDLTISVASQSYTCAWVTPVQSL